MPSWWVTTNLLTFPSSTNLEPWQSLIVVSWNAHCTMAEAARMFNHKVGQKTWWIWGTARVALHIHNQMGRSKAWWVFAMHKWKHVPDVYTGDGERDVFLLVVMISNDEITLLCVLWPPLYTSLGQWSPNSSEHVSNQCSAPAPQKTHWVKCLWEHCEWGGDEWREC